MTNIMIVDDEALMRRGISTLIDWESLNCRIVASVENGQQAVAAYQKEKPQIVISDIRMPVMDGLALCKWFHDHAPTVKIILLTAFADFSYAQKAISFGVSEYVTKTGDMEQIAEAVKKCQLALEKEDRTAEAHQGNQISLLHAVLSGSPLGGAELANRARQCQLQLSFFYLLLVDVAQPVPLSEAELSRLRLNAQKLFESEFRNETHYSIPLTSARFAVLLGISGNCDPQQAVAELMQMFAGITHHTLYLAASRNHQTLAELRCAYEEAQAALSLSFYDKTAFHAFRHYTEEPRMKEEASLLDRLGDGLRTGNAPLSGKALEDIFAEQLSVRPSEAAARQTGEAVLGLCRRSLGRVGLELDAIGVVESNWLQEFATTKFFEDCCARLRTLVAETCTAIETTLHSGSNLVVNAQYYIDTHFCEPITLKDIAEAVKANPSYLSRCFKQKTGTNLIDALTQKRMDYAKRLIEEGRLKIFEIAEALGFEDTTYFSHVFRRYAGMSAKEYHDAYIQKQNGGGGQEAE